MRKKIRRIEQQETVYMAKTTEGNHWTKGVYFKHLNRQPSPIGDEIKPEDYTHYIISSGFADWNMPKPVTMEEIRPETLRRKSDSSLSGKDLYEKDVVHFLFYDGLTEEYYWVNGMIVYTDHGWKVMVPDRYESEDRMGGIYWRTMEDLFRNKKPELVGNIIDNPELGDEFSL